MGVSSSSGSWSGVTTPYTSAELTTRTRALPPIERGRGQDLGRAEHVDAQHLARVLPALTDVGHGGQVVDGLGRDVGHDPADGGAVGHVRLDVDHGDLVARGP